MIKRIVSIILCALFVVSASITSVAATEYGNYAGGDMSQYVPLEDQIEKLLSNPDLTGEQRQKILNKYERALRAMTETTSERSDAISTRAIVSLFVPFCEQENEYYCGPATTQQTYYYLNNKIYNSNTAPSQDEIAEDIRTNDKDGSDLEVIKDYLNGVFHLDYIVIWWWGSAATMADSIHQAIDEDERPTLLHIRVYSIGNSGWKFTTGGHYVNVEGYSTNGTYLIVDPFRDGHGVSTGRYVVSINDIFNYKVRMAY